MLMAEDLRTILETLPGNMEVRINSSVDFKLELDFNGTLPNVNFVQKKTAEVGTQ